MTLQPASGAPRCVVMGGGGHAKVLLDCLQAVQASVYAILDAEPARWGQQVLGVPIMGGDQLLGEMAQAGVTHFVIGFAGIGTVPQRRALFDLALSQGLSPLTIIHPSAICSPWATIGQGCQLLPGSIVNAGAILGTAVIINSGAVVEHDCQLGDYAHVAPRAVLASTVQVGPGAHVGVGATVRECCVIGAGAIVAAGAVVVNEVKPGSTVGGVPARPLESSSTR